MTNVGKNQVLEHAKKGKVWLIKGQSNQAGFEPTQHHGSKSLMVRSSNDEHGNIGESQCTCFGQN
jgi:hypothetical protein